MACDGCVPVPVCCCTLLPHKRASDGMASRAFLTGRLRFCFLLWNVRDRRPLSDCQPLAINTKAKCRPPTVHGLPIQGEY